MGTVIAQGYGGATVLQVLNAISNVPPSPASGSVTLTFNDNVAVAPIALNPSSWAILDTTNNIPLPITLVTFAGKTITLITNEQDTGANYTVTIPQVGITDAVTGYVLVAPYTITFVGQGLGPTILYTRLVNETTIELEYSKPVIVGEAVVSSNYAVSNGITVASVAQVPNSSTIFRITTFQKMVPNTLYTLTVYNVQDLAGNPV